MTDQQQADDINGKGTMKGRTKITINRETLKQLLEEHLAETLIGRVELQEYTVHRNGSIELVVVPRNVAPALPLEPEGERKFDHAEYLGEVPTGISQE